MITKTTDMRHTHPTTNGSEKMSPETKLREVAALYEKHFLGEIVKAMRNTIPEGGFIQTNQAEKIFREKLDQEYVENWGNCGGIGLQNLIYNQLIEKFGVQMGIKIPESKPRGPIPINEGIQFRANPQHLPQNGGLTTRFERIDSIDHKLGVSTNWLDEPRNNLHLSAPWDGRLVNKLNLNDFENLLEIDHGGGLKSQIVYTGVPSTQELNTPVEAGQSLAVLSPSAKGFFWNLLVNKT